MFLTIKQEILHKCALYCLAYSGLPGVGGQTRSGKLERLPGSLLMTSNDALRTTLFILRQGEGDVDVPVGELTYILSDYLTKYSRGYALLSFHSYCRSSSTALCRRTRVL